MTPPPPLWASPLWDGASPRQQGKQKITILGLQSSFESRDRRRGSEERDGTQRTDRRTDRGQEVVCWLIEASLRVAHGGARRHGAAPGVFQEVCRPRRHEGLGPRAEREELGQAVQGLQGRRRQGRHGHGGRHRLLQGQTEVVSGHDLRGLPEGSGGVGPKEVQRSKSGGGPGVHLQAGGRPRAHQRRSDESGEGEGGGPADRRVPVHRVPQGALQRERQGQRSRGPRGGGGPDGLRGRLQERRHVRRQDEGREITESRSWPDHREP